MSHGPMKRPEPPDMHEKGASRGEEPQLLDRRLFVQVQVFTGATEADDCDAIAAAVEESTLPLVLYQDVTDPFGFGLVSVAEDPAFFVNEYRDFIINSTFSELEFMPEMSMIGRTYGSGREADLQSWLLDHVPNRLTDDNSEFAIWYPLKRKPGFYVLEGREVGMMMAEHGMLGRSYGESGLAADIRLKSFGLDRQDNEFVIGLVGKDLHPLSRLVEDMRVTRQTSEWMESLGPFFVGKRLAMGDFN